MTDLEAIINTVEFRLHEDAAGTCRILNGENETVFESADYFHALDMLETEYLTPEQVEALRLHHEVMEELQTEEKTNRALCCDHFAGF